MMMESTNKINIVKLSNLCCSVVATLNSLETITGLGKKPKLKDLRKRINALRTLSFDLNKLVHEEYEKITIEIKDEELRKRVFIPLLPYQLMMEEEKQYLSLHPLLPSECFKSD